jgi:hypothetical protein
MAKIVVKNATVLLHSLNLSSYSNNCGIPLSIEPGDATNFAGDGWRSRVPGLRDSEWNIEGFLDHVDPEATLYAYASGLTSRPLGASLTNPVAASDVMYFADCVGLSYQPNKAIGNMYGYSINAKEASPLTRGICLETIVRTSTGNSTPIDLGVAIAAGERLYYACWVTAVAGTTPTLDLVLESDTVGFASATTRATLSQFTTVGSAFGYVDGAVTDTYWRVNATVGGSGGPSFTYVFAIGRVVRSI